MSNQEEMYQVLILAISGLDDKHKARLRNDLNVQLGTPPPELSLIAYSNQLQRVSDKAHDITSGTLASFAAFNEANNWLWRLNDVAANCAATGNFRPLKPYLESNNVSAKIIKGLYDLGENLHKH